MRVLVVLVFLSLTMAAYADPSACPNLGPCPIDPNDCQYGLKQENGCPVCECEPCPLPICFIFCEFGFKLGSFNCPICECNPCPPDNCTPDPGACQFGLQFDSNGCKTGQCRSSFNECPSLEDCPLVEEECAEGFGFSVDLNGCSICECSKCPPQICLNECGVNGRKRGPGPNFCPLCECNPCPPDTCGIPASQCQFGFKYDASGCKICECAPNAGNGGN